LAIRPVLLDHESGEQARGGGDRFSCALALGAAIGVGAAFITHVWILNATVVVCLAVAGGVGLRRSREAAALALAAATFVAIFFVPAVARLTPAPLLLALGVLLLATQFRAPWLTRGEIGGAVVAWIAAIVVVSGVALIAWWKLARPDVSDLTLASELRDAVARPAILAAALVGWSCLNAAAEEFFFRGALQRALTQSLGPAPGIVVQAAVFGLIHYRGFPRGWSGVALATTYGLMLGALRLRARGLLAPWLAHVAADVVIAIILLALAR
jgi:CAAX protease family protein